MKNLTFTIENALIIGLLSVVSYYSIGYALMRDELTNMEFSLFTLAYGGLLFFITLFTVLMRFPSYIKDYQPKWFDLYWKHILLVLVFTVLIDSSYHYLLDKNLGLALAESLKTVVPNTEENQALISLYKQLSPSLQNYVMNIVAVLMGASISFPIAYKLSRSLHTPFNSI